MFYNQRTDDATREPAVLLKLSFTSAPLSIQVHADDTLSGSMGQPRGTSEAWYILTARPTAEVAVGLHDALPPVQFRDAIDDRMIADMIACLPVSRQVARRCCRANPAAAAPSCSAYPQEALT